MTDRRKEARERLKRRRALAKQRERDKVADKVKSQPISSVPVSVVTPKDRAIAPQVSSSTPHPAATGTKVPAQPGQGIDMRKTATPAEAKQLEKQRRSAIDALERDVLDLTRLSMPTGQTAAEIERVRREVEELKRDFYAHLGAWQRLQVARHPQRPYPEDFIRLLFENFSEIHGDRNFADDAAMLAGMAWFHGKPVMVLGTQKGRDTKQRVARNFGQVKPEGYRKALRVMQLAAKFHRPVFVFVDTPGAYPGVGAEERGQAEAIAHNLREMSRLPVPILITITGEGGSGGALAIAVGDRVFMLENSVYSVISPEGCASIMWRDSTKAEIAAEALKITAPDLLELKLVDEIVPEPEGGAHADHAGAAKLLDPVLANALAQLSQYSPRQLVDLRYEKFRRMGQFFA